MRTRERFEASYKIVGTHWIWTRYADDKGYPKMVINGKSPTARCISARLHGKADRFDRFSTRLLCGESLCVNPDHFRVVGSRSGNANFTKSEIKAIRLLHEDEHSAQCIADYFKCGYNAIREIVNYETYCNIR